MLQGIKHLRGYGTDDNARALALFKQALQIDPDFALANAYHALAEVIIHDYEAPAAVMTSALASAQRAVELDLDDSRCHWILAQIHRFRGDFRAAQQHYERASAMNPNDANAMASYGRKLATLGRHDEGIDRIREAMRLNPYHPDWYWQTLGAVLYIARRYEDAVEALANVTHAGFWYRCYLAASYAQLGRIKEANEFVKEACHLRPGCSLSKLRVRDLGRTGYDLLIEGLRKAGMPD